MSVARNSIKKVPSYTYTFKNYYGSGLGGNLYGAAASPTVAIAIGVATASTGAATTNRGVIYYTTDGNVWSSVSTTTFGNNSIIACAYGNNTFVAVGYGNIIATSPGTSGSTWTARTSAITGNYTYLTFQGGYFLAKTASSNNIAYSTDGITWTSGVSVPATIYSYDSGSRGGIFYISQNPSTSRWLHCNGTDFNTVTTTSQFYVMDGITNTANTNNIQRSGSSRHPQYFADGRFLIQTSEISASDNPGFHSLLNTTDLGSVEGFPSQRGYADGNIGFFPYVEPSDEILPVTTTPYANALAIKYSVANGAATVAGYKRAYYVYNDGYYNCLFAGNGSGTMPFYTPLINASFNGETMSFVSRPQTLGSGYAGQSVWSQLGSFRYGMQYAFDITFKGKNYIFSGGSNNVNGSNYLVGTQTYVRV